MAQVDCLIIGAGPAGLTAAIYAARFWLSVVVVDGGASRAALIPCTRNHSGFPDGISGVDLLGRMRTQALKFGAAIIPATVEALEHGEGQGFKATGDFLPIEARAVILATGVTNRRPPMEAAVHDEALKAGLLRYCAVCDAFEVTDRKVAVIGTGAHGVREAAFLRAYTQRVTLIAPEGPHELSAAEQGRLAKLGVVPHAGPARDFRLQGDQITLEHSEGREAFDTVYPALGSDIHSDLARSLGASLTDEGCIRVDGQQRTSIRGLYAAGDVVIGLDQISHAMGEAGVAATTLRNDLAQTNDPLR
ncbi:NAD(P)/FAD-dependent oxidoreductase [Caulobacter sp. DWP3-1-3b2]|uniref:NAD(P)/FAD-dependent oxidoreductase n=1 Tax=Caulobacter sp. DWP3-1-3b2 TaxID=2804643 RepID=UPI003CE8674C